MGRFDEACFLCGICSNPPNELSPDSESTAESLVKALLNHDRDLLSKVEDHINTEENLLEYLIDIIEDVVPADLDNCGEAFSTCIAVGYFGHDSDGYPPFENVDDPVIRRKIPDGCFVTTRLVEDGSCGDFTAEVIRRTNDIGEIVQVCEDRLSRTGAYWQKGFGNFYISESCYRFLEGWLDYAGLPPMWDGRKLSFAGELYEILNSRETGREDGWLEWLNPGGPELTLDQTQDYLETDVVLPKATAEGLKMGFNREQLSDCIYEDHGYWKFATPHRWPHAAESEDFGSVSIFGFSVIARIPDASGSLTRFPAEILVQIFGWLPDFATYLSLMSVSVQMHNLITDVKFTTMVLREMLQPDPARGLFWVYPVKTVSREVDEFAAALKSWVVQPSESTQPKNILFSSGFPLIHFLHRLYTNDHSRNRRRLWATIKRLEDIWVDYRANGWKVDRFGVPYPTTPT